MTSLRVHATSELDLADIADPVRAATIGIVGTMAGLSPVDWATVNTLVGTLLIFLPLPPLTVDPSPWLNRSSMLGEKSFWQSRRNPDVWSSDQGKTYSLLSEPGRVHTSAPSISVPPTP